jgi:hypothetical protein
MRPLEAGPIENTEVRRQTGIIGRSRRLLNKGYKKRKSLMANYIDSGFWWVNQSPFDRPH